jgi:hypothetical protein
MSDGAAHLLIPFAATQAQGCLAARKALALPALDKLLAGLRPAAANDGDERTLSPPHERVLAREFGLTSPDGCIPWAAWQVAQAQRDAQGAAWAWITPCYWQVGQDHIAMTNPADLELAAGESQALLQAVQPYFTEDGIALEYDTPTRWLARGDVFRGFASTSLDRVIGHTVDAWLPHGREARTIRRLQQEMQMLLYTHEANETRARGGLLPVNSFWVSGTGALPASSAPHPPQLAVTHALRDAALLQDWNAWASAWRRIDETECARLLRSLDAGEHVSLTLCGERNARTFSGARGGLLGKLASSLRASRVAATFDSL